jgi:hypothetical protein
MTQQASTAHQAQWNPLENNTTYQIKKPYIYIYIFAPEGGFMILLPQILWPVNLFTTKVQKRAAGD